MLPKIDGHRKKATDFYLVGVEQINPTCGFNHRSDFVFDVGVYALLSVLSYKRFVQRINLEPFFIHKCMIYFKSQLFVQSQTGFVVGSHL